MLSQFAYSEGFVYVSRLNIIEDFKELYQQREFNKLIPRIRFKGEKAVGDGVTREVFSSFFHEISKSFDGNEAKVPSTDRITDDDLLNLFGLVTTHAFILFGMFPIQLSQAFVLHMLCKKAADEILIENFMQYLHTGEARIVRSSMITKESFDPFIVSDILADFGLNALPNNDNIKGLIVQASKSIFVKKAMYVANLIKDGMGCFWNGVRDTDLIKVYAAAQPTHESFLSVCDFEETNKKDGKCTIWFSRYVRCCSSNDLKRLLRFITGCSQLLPDTNIRVKFEDTVGESIRPRCRSCFMILFLSRNYVSFDNMLTNLNLHLADERSWEMEG